MKKSLVAGALVAIFTLGSCATSTGSGGGGLVASFVPSDCPRKFTKRQQYTCAGATCKIRVQVVWNAGTRTCEVEVENDKTIISGVQAGRVRMEWENVSAPDWEFHDEAMPFAAPIMFKMPPQPPGANFIKDAASPVTAEKAVLINLMQSKGPFNYSVRVFHRQTQTGIEVDPALVNDY